MKISSKSILSPGRAGVRNPPTSLSTSRSRRLRTSGSVRGGASPATFSAKKRGTFENPEPSSPKVTCIGQVRVRSRRKQAKKLRTLSKRRSAGEVSVRKQDHPLNGFPSKRLKHRESLNLGSKGTQNDQKRWVLFPVTICDSLRALFPCRGKEEKTVVGEDGNREGSCGEDLARWLVEVQDEVVVGNEEEQEEEEEVWKTRRHVFEDLQIVGDRIEGHQDEARVGSCVPPKNALLLMRGRSDPVKIEALASRSWEPSVERTEEEDEIVDDGDQIEEDLEMPKENVEVGQEQVMILDQDQENVQQDEVVIQDQENVQQDEVIQDEVNQDQEQEIEQEDEVGQDEEHDNVQHYEVGQCLEHDSEQQDEPTQDQEQEIEQQENEVGQGQEQDNVQNYEVGQGQEQELDQTEEESFYLESLFEEIVNQDYIQEQDKAHDEEVGVEIESDESTMMTETHEEEMVLEKESEVKEEVLPECLLMMMYEPKLSMEVSKETWVCRTDFIQRQNSKRKPPAPVPVPATAELDGGDEASVSANVTVNDVMRVAGGGFPAVLPQPARSSCTLPAASMAVVLEQKLASAVGYEPFVLKRCKSEPVKTAAAKLQPESCVLENRKLERLSRAAISVGAAGLGF